MTAEVQVQEEVVRRDDPSEDGHASEVPSEEVAPQKENAMEASSQAADGPTTDGVETSEEAPLDGGPAGLANHRQVMSMTQIDRDGLRDAYSDVRDDKSEINWAVFKYDGSQVVVAAKGETFDEFKSQFGEDERAFAYLRLQTGDEMSKRSKFLLLTWVGTGVSPIKKAKMSTDKALVKEILANFAVELTLESTTELDHDAFLQELIKAGGANYGTGVRD